MKFAVIASLLAVLAAPGAGSAPPVVSPRVDLPITEVDYGGDRRYTVTVDIAGHPVQTGVDTGSTGLRVLPRAMPPDGKKGEHVHYGYSSGIGLDGRVVTVRVALGAVAGEAKVMGVEKVACDHPQAQCGNFHLDIASYGIQGDGVPGQGFPAILGIGFRPDTVGNPLVELGVHRWIIDLPRPGDSGRGRLILNPTDDEVAGYQRLKLSGEGNQIDGCLLATSARGKACAPMVFDSGAPGIRLMGLGGTPWPRGTAVDVQLTDGKRKAEMPLVIGRRDLASAMMIQPGAQGRPPMISLGLAPYFHWSVLYDADAHQIGLRERN